jgi:hypothetical protein
MLGTVPRTVWIVLAVTAAAAILLVGLKRASGPDIERVRTEMLAGCQDTAAPEARPLCSCMVDEVLRRNGTSREDLARLDGEVRAAQNGSGPIPAVMQQAANACAAASRPSG